MPQERPELFKEFMSTSSALVAIRCLLTHHRAQLRLTLRWEAFVPPRGLVLKRMAILAEA